ncbi:hypothetical protein BH10ACT1_BH10ACT1_11270 [soil metagenome]
MTDSTEASRTAGLVVGTRVEVRNGFDGSWSTGFQIDAVERSGYRLRRRSDGQVLPTVFTAESVRREHKSSMWWI